MAYDIEVLRRMEDAGMKLAKVKLNANGRVEITSTSSVLDLQTMKQKLTSKKPRGGRRTQLSLDDGWVHYGALGNLERKAGMKLDEGWSGGADDLAAELKLDVSVVAFEFGKSVDELRQLGRITITG